MFFQYPDDEETNTLDEQFFIGDAILVAPVLSKGDTTVDVYFPNSDVFYDFYTGKAIEPEDSASSGMGGWTTVEAPIDTMPMFFRGGVIVYGQLPGLNTVDSRKNEMIFHVPLSTEGIASGILDIDDGISLNISLYDELSCSAMNNSTGGSLSCKTTNRQANEQRNVGVVYVYGVNEKVKSVQLGATEIGFDYHDNVLLVEGIQQPMLGESWSVSWST